MDIFSPNFHFSPFSRQTTVLCPIPVQTRFQPADIRPFVLGHWPLLQGVLHWLLLHGELQLSQGRLMATVATKVAATTEPLLPAEVTTTDDVMVTTGATTRTTGGAHPATTVGVSKSSTSGGGKGSPI